MNSLKSAEDEVKREISIPFRIIPAYRATLGFINIVEPKRVGTVLATMDFYLCYNTTIQ